MARPAVFFDRDNTLIASDGYLGDPDQVELVHGAASAVARATQLGYAVVVVSNQSGVARGLFGEEAVDAVNRRMDEMLRAADPAAVVVMHVFCPFHPDAVIDAYRQDSALRKPSPGMLRLAAEQLDLDLAHSWLVGDAPRDIEAGRRAGCRTILFNDPTLPLSPAAREPLETPPDQIVSTLGQAIDYIEVHGDAPPPAKMTATMLEEPAAEPQAVAVADEPIARVPLFSRNERSEESIDVVSRPSLFARSEDASTTAVISELSVAEVDEELPPAGAAVDDGLVLVDAERDLSANGVVDPEDGEQALNEPDDSVPAANPWVMTPASEDESAGLPEVADESSEEQSAENDIDLFKAADAAAAVDEAAEAPTGVGEAIAERDSPDGEEDARVEEPSAFAPPASIEEHTIAPPPPSDDVAESSESTASADTDVSQHFLEPVEIASPAAAAELLAEPEPLIRPSAWVHRANTPREHEPTVSPADDLLSDSPAGEEPGIEPARDESPVERVEAPIADLPPAAATVTEPKSASTNDVIQTPSKPVEISHARAAVAHAESPIAPSPRGMVAATILAAAPADRPPPEVRRASPDPVTSVPRTPAAAPAPPAPRVEPSRPSEPLITPRMELLTEQILRELRRRDSPRAADFSLPKLAAAVMQVIAVGLLALAVYNWNNAAGNVYAFLMAAQLVQTFVVAMMLVDRKS